MPLLPLGWTASPLMPELLSQSLIHSGCLIQQYSTLKYRLQGVGHHLKRFCSHDAALAESGEGAIVDKHVPAEAVSRGFEMGTFKARQAERLRLAIQKSAAKVTVVKKTTAARSERTMNRALRKTKERNWLAWVRKLAEPRRIMAEMLGDDTRLGWEDAVEANAAQLDTLLAAQRAAADAEEAMQRADPADPASMNEARRLKDHATELTELASKQMDIYEEVRAKVKAKETAHSKYLDEPDKTTLRATVHGRCRICLLPHFPGACPYLFDDPNGTVRRVVPDPMRAASKLFQKRWEVDAQFREAILYLRSKFARAPESTEIIPSFQRKTRDAPSSAIRESPVSPVFRGQENIRRLAFSDNPC